MEIKKTGWAFFRVDRKNLTAKIDHPKKKIILPPKKLFAWEDPALIKPTREEAIEEFFPYVVLIALGDASNEDILSEMPMNCFSEQKRAIGDIISFDFVEVIKTLEKSNNKKTIKLCKKIFKEHGRVLGTNKYRVVNILPPNDLLIKPVLPPEGLFKNRNF
jgi:hypothetical protein